MSLGIEAVQGDVTRSVQVDAIATLVNSGGMWFGGVDGAIMRVAGGYYHGSLSYQMKHKANGQKVSDGDVFIVKGRTPFPEAFMDVIFVIDDLHLPLKELVYAGLKAAGQEGYASLALPLMRTGVMLGVVEKTLEKTVQSMATGIRRFREEYGDRMKITVVVYNDPRAMQLLAAQN